MKIHAFLKKAREIKRQHITALLAVIAVTLTGFTATNWAEALYILTGVENPLLAALDLGFGNETKGGAEGIHYKNVFGSHLTGPLLVKNPRLLDAVIFAIYEKRGETCPAIPHDTLAEEGYAVTARELKALCGK